ncbi:MAG: 1-deoxy-D-xylulose-5-phosphate synthase [Actinobacteria bacterium]|nr:1-deoxy-D-xylulose-5-phosphate synthase [Actinomycetota bacterium]
MLLETIESPADLRGLTHSQLDELAAEIRAFIVDAVSKTGGHLGSNLGVVELTLAVHRVFDSPRDIILWDTGHLAYPHKILTGRRQRFDTLRQGGGLSGYPSRAESEHDWVENSHASTILSYAHGLAQARDTGAGDAHRHVVAVLGDGSMTGGMAYEGLNNLGHSGRNVIIILNDNGRSYAPTVSRLAESVARLRIDPRYTRQRDRVEKLVRGVPVVGQHLAWGMTGALAGVREMLEPPVFFETLGVRYTGPFDGHDIAGVERALVHASEHDGPIVVHVLTQKGRGYPPAEEDDENRLHDSGRFDLATGPEPKGGSAPRGSYTQAFSEALVKEAELRPEVVAITAAMPGSTGLLPFQERFPERFVDVGIAEQHAVTAAAGMAMGGLRPVVAIYSTFLTRAIDQASLDVGLHGQPVVFCIDRAGITGPDGASAHGVLDMVLLSKIPGMTIFAPSSYQELQVMLHDALEITTGPCAIRWPRTPARMVGEEEVGHGLRARRVREGGDVCLVGVGKMLAVAEEAAERLAAGGIGCTVWDPRVVKPLDPALVAEAAAHDLVVSIEDGYREGGFGSMLADAVAEATLGTDRNPRVRVLGVPVRYLAHGNPDEILADLGLDAAGVEAEVRRCLAR